MRGIFLFLILSAINTAQGAQLTQRQEEFFQLIKECKPLFEVKDFYSKHSHEICINTIPEKTKTDLRIHAILHSRDDLAVYLAHIDFQQISKQGLRKPSLRAS